MGWHNPAWPVRLPQTAITATLLGTGAVGTEPSGSRFVGSVRPDGFYAGVPLPLNGRLALGLDESFNQDFDIWTESLHDNPYRYRVVSRGGIYALKAGLAWSFLDLGSIGAEYSRRLGAARENWRLEIPGGRSSVDTVELNYAAHGFKLGAAFEYGRLGFGAWFGPGLEYDVSTLRRAHGRVGDTPVRQRLRVPSTTAAGLRLAAARRLELSAGVEYRPWSGITIDGTGHENWRDVLRLSSGLELALDTLRALRLGYSCQGHHYALDWYASGSPEPRPVFEHRLHAGTGVPVPGFGSLEFALEIARRDNGILTEYAGRLMLSLAYREAWLRRSRRWGY